MTTTQKRKIKWKNKKALVGLISTYKDLLNLQINYLKRNYKKILFYLSYTRHTSENIQNFVKVKSVCRY